MTTFNPHQNYQKNVDFMIKHETTIIRATSFYQQASTDSHGLLTGSHDVLAKAKQAKTSAST
jgi:hypothetical protein